METKKEKIDASKFDEMMDNDDPKAYEGNWQQSDRKVRRLNCDLSASNMENLDKELTASDFRTRTALINSILSKRYKRVKV